MISLLPLICKCLGPVHLASRCLLLFRAILPPDHECCVQTWHWCHERYRDIALDPDLDHAVVMAADRALELDPVVGHGIKCAAPSLKLLMLSITWLVLLRLHLLLLVFVPLLFS